MAEFAPGPWTVDDGGIRCDHKHNYGIVAQVYSGVVYSEYTSDSPTLEFENIADAHLVAAAPELYEALGLAVAIADKRGIYGPDIDKMRAALAKARGEYQEQPNG